MRVPGRSGGREVLVELSRELRTLRGSKGAGSAEKFVQAPAAAERDAGDLLVDQREFGADEAKCASHTDVECRTVQCSGDGIDLESDTVKRAVRSRPLMKSRSRRGVNTPPVRRTSSRPRCVFASITQMPVGVMARWSMFA